VLTSVAELITELHQPQQAIKADDSDQSLPVPESDTAAPALPIHAAGRESGSGGQGKEKPKSDQSGSSGDGGQADAGVNDSLSRDDSKCDQKSRKRCHSSSDEEEDDTPSKIRDEDASSGASQINNEIDWHQVFHEMHVAMALISVDGRIIDTNRTFEDLTGYSKQQLLAMTFFSLAQPRDEDDIYQSVAEMLRAPYYGAAVPELITRLNPSHCSVDHPLVLKLSPVRDWGENPDIIYLSCALLRADGGFPENTA